MTDYEYDVAFSFHQADEGIAQQLNDLLADRFSTFIYSERQKVLAGRDGEQAFAEVYAKKARVVVVFSRREWGETAFTRIEQTAIRGRAYDEGYDFTLFVPTDEPPAVPVWLPRTQLWFGLKRFGLDGAAAVVEQKIQAQGGEGKVESIGERAARAMRAKKLAAERKRFLDSDEGVDAAKAAYEVLLAQIRADVEDLKTSAGLTLSVLERYGEMVIQGMDGSVHIRFPLRYTNVLGGFPVQVDFADGPPKVHWLDVFDEPRTWSRDRYQYALLGPDRQGYQEVGAENREFSPVDLARHILGRHIDLTEAHGDRRR